MSQVLLTDAPEFPAILQHEAVKSQQLSLFEQPVHIGGYTRHDGTFVPPHTSRRRKKPARPHAAKPPAPEHEPPKPKQAEAPAPAKPLVLVRRKKAAPAEPPTAAATPARLAAELPEPPSAPGARRRANTQAMAILAEKTDTQITEQDRAALARYSGRGGIGDSLNEYYTPAPLVGAIWKIAQAAGIGPGHTVLEPSCGTGAFLKMAPSGTTVVGVELDGTSSRIARALHPQHQVVQSTLERFATSDPRLFDAVVGNPPFGLRGEHIKDDKPDIPRAELYFVDTALDKTREGGLVALIVPTGVVDAASARRYRRDMLCKGEFLGAHRMPNTAFKHSQTEVTTDLVLFRRRAPDVAQALLTLDDDALRKLGVLDQEFIDGQYFYGERGRPLIYGALDEGWRAKAGIGDDITVTGAMDGVAEAIGDWTPPAPGKALTMQDVTEALGDDTEAIARARRAALRPPYEVARLGDTKTVEGIAYVLQGEPPRWHRLDDAQGEPAHVIAGRQIGESIEAFAGGSGGSAAIHEALDAYVKKYGIPRGNADITSRAPHDKALYRLLSAVRDDGSYSDLLTGRGSADMRDTTAVADRLSLEQNGFTVAELAKATDLSAAEAEDLLHASDRYAFDPAAKTWCSMHQYLTGELWPKLDEVRGALANPATDASLRPKLELQATRLEEAIQPKSLEDVEITLASGWVPLDVVAAWQNAKIADWNKEHASASWRPTTFELSFDKGVFTIKGGWGTNDLLEKYLNRSGVRQEDWPRVELMNREFRDWLLASEHRDHVEDIYNRSHTGFVRRKFSDATMEIPGLNPAFEVNPYHYAGLRWALANGKGIIAADVGLGKTGRALMLARLATINGQAKKPLIVVPKSVLANWKAECEAWFPGSRVLVIGESYTTGKDGKVRAKEDSAAVRATKYHDLAQNTYDFTLISQPAWNELDLSPVHKGEYIESDFWTQRADSMGKASDKRREKIRTAYKQAIAGREFEKRADVIHFEDLGVDMLFLDEGHHYKNLFSARNRFGENPKFLGGSGESNRALDTNLKARWVREQNGGKNIYPLTATPTKNSPLEVYSMLQLVAPEAFERMGIRNSEDFLDRFCVFRREAVLGVDGTIEEALITSGFKNLDELREVMRRHIDRTTAADVGLKLPERDEREHLVEMTAAQHAVYEDLRQQATLGQDADGADAHIFSIMDKMGKASMDLELLDPEAHAGAESPKYRVAAEHIVAGAKEGGQVVFCEHVAAHEKMRQALVAAGIPAERIAIVNAAAAPSSGDRQKIADAFNRGDLDVVVGNRTMEEGMNLQKRTTDIHHMDLPWEPATMHQRNGRGVRQGNKSLSVRIHRYVARGSFDGYRYQTLVAKKDWQDQLWNGGKQVENLAKEGALSRDDLLVMLSANPEEAKAKMAGNKALAAERLKANRRKEAGQDFARFRQMSQSYNRIENKNTKSAIKLRLAITQARERLQASEHFDAPEALDAPDSVVISQKTGRAWRPGMAFEFTVKDHQPVNMPDGTHRAVIERLDTHNNGLHARHVGGTASFGFKADEMGDEYKPVTFDADTDEAQRMAASLQVDGYKIAKRLAGGGATPAIAKRLEAGLREAIQAYTATNTGWHRSAAGRAGLWTHVGDTVRTLAPEAGQEEREEAVDRMQLDSLLAAHGIEGGGLKLSTLTALPAAVVTENANTLQRGIRTGILDYSVPVDGPVGLLTPAGQPIAFAGYDARTHLEDHQLMLPTEHHRSLAQEAFMAARRERTLERKHHEPPRHRRSSGYASGTYFGLAARYKGFEYGSHAGKPWAAIDKAQFKGAVAPAAKAALAKEGSAAIDAAPDFGAAFAAALPALDIDYSGAAAFAPGHLAGLAAAAQRTGALDKKLNALGASLPWAALDSATDHQRHSTSTDETLRQALSRKARASAEAELADRLAGKP